MDCISKLPDCLLSDILSMLSMKDLLKSSILSKRWLKLWALRRDLNFDIHNMLGSEKEMVEAGYLCHVRMKNSSNYHKNLKIGLCSARFVERVDKFVKNFQGTKIDSFKVAFHLTYKQSSFIDQWISFAITRGVGRIDLLLSGNPYINRDLAELERYKFPFDLFSASTLRHMHLQNCVLWHPVDFNFVPFSNLRSLVLEDTYVDETLITSLLSCCPLLEELSLMHCWFISSMLDIVSSSLRHLKVRWCLVKSNSDEFKLSKIHVRSLDCLKLTSLELQGCSLEPFSINAPLLKMICCCNTCIYQLPNVLALFANLPHLETLNLGTYPRIQMVEAPLRSIGLFKTLKLLNLFVSCTDLEEDGFDILWILNILKACPLLQKLSFMVTDPELSEDQKESKDLDIFSRSELKVVEMGGCVGNWYEIEFAMNVLKYAHSIEQIVLSPYWRYENTSDWNSDPAWFLNGRERVREKLQGEAVGQAQLILM